LYRLLHNSDLRTYACIFLLALTTPLPSASSHNSNTLLHGAQLIFQPSNATYESKVPKGGPVPAAETPSQDKIKMFRGINHRTPACDRKCIKHQTPPFARPGHQNENRAS
jgi:hypothetical protein